MCLHTDNIFVIFLGNRLHKIGIYPNENMLTIVLCFIELNNLNFGSRRIIYVVSITCKN